MKNNQFEWEVYSPITRKRHIFKFILLGIMLCLAMYISSFAGGSYKAQNSAPNPAKEYPQENTAIINVKNLPGNTIKSMEKDELYDYMDAVGFQRLKGKSLVDLRRIYLGFMYDDFFYSMHKKTNLPISVIYAFFIIEATSNGLESKLMLKALNPGGIKYTGKGSKMKAMDDCYKGGRKVPCDFQAYNDYQSMIDGWASIMNLPRYKGCKKYIYSKYNRGMKPKQIVDSICKCFYKSGYHTSNLWKVRSNLSTEYWTVKTSFPNLEY
jgi:hypothetical protein